MHSHDRTILANLAFADPDKKDLRHGLACQYLATPEVALRVASRVLESDVILSEPIRCVHEFAISKGTGQYKTTIGFLDLLCKVARVDCVDSKSRKNPIVIEVKIAKTSAADILRQINIYREFSDSIAVKIFPGAIEYFNQLGKPGDRRARQVMDNCISWFRWVVVTAFPLSPSDVDMLRSSGIHLLRLGESFHNWVAEQESLRIAQESSGDPDDSIEI